MNWSLMIQQLTGYAVASLVTWAATRYHLSTDQQGILTTDIMGIAAFASATVFGLWTNHRAYLSNPPDVQAKVDLADARNPAASIRDVMASRATTNNK